MTTQWEPGQPLHQNPACRHQSGIFSFRDDSASERCTCADAASWPEPMTTQRLYACPNLEPLMTEVSA